MKSILIGNCNRNIEDFVLSCSSKKRVLNKLSEVFKELGENVVRIIPSSDEILWIRDIYIPIDNTYVIGNLTQDSTMNRNRSDEYEQIIPYFNSYKKIITSPKKVKLEGGDIIQQDDFIFVGLGERTNMEAVHFLKQKFPKKHIIPITHTSLHLDCVFCVLDKNVFYDSKYISHLDLDGLFHTYDISHMVDSGKYLATNFVRINNTLITSNTPQNASFRQLLRNMGYKIKMVDTKGIWREGGSIRCLTQWL